MLIFRFEWKRKRKYILIWAATLAGLYLLHDASVLWLLKRWKLCLWNLHREAFLKRLVFLWSY